MLQFIFLQPNNRLVSRSRSSESSYYSLLITHYSLPITHFVWTTDWDDLTDLTDFTLVDSRLQALGRNLTLFILQTSNIKLSFFNPYSFNPIIAWAEDQEVPTALITHYSLPITHFVWTTDWDDLTDLTDFTLVDSRLQALGRNSTLFILQTSNIKHQTIFLQSIFLQPNSRLWSNSRSSACSHSTFNLQNLTFLKSPLIKFRTFHQLLLLITHYSLPIHYPSRFHI